MNKFYFVFIIAISACLFLQACQTKQNKTNISISKNSSNKPILQNKAIELAENFITHQGYTHLATQITMENVVFEPGEIASDLTKLMQNRNNLLKKPAYGARQYGEFNKWAVAFEYVNSENNIGRGVSMDSLGNNLRLDSDEIRLDWIDEWQAE